MVASARQRRRAACAFLLFLAASLVLFAIVHFVDHAVTARVAHWRGPVLDGVVRTINPIGNGVTLLVACAALAVLARWLGRSRLHDAACLAAAAFMSAGLVEYTLKHLVDRPRPLAGRLIAGLPAPSLGLEIDSFPSGHATSVFAVATVFGAYYPALRVPLYLLAAAIALGRVYLVRHYVSDILAGAALGIVCAAYLYRHRRSLPSRVMLESSPNAA